MRFNMVENLLYCCHTCANRTYTHATRALLLRETARKYIYITQLPKSKVKVPLGEHALSRTFLCCIKNFAEYSQKALPRYVYHSVTNKAKPSTGSYLQITTPTLANKLIQVNERLFLASSPKTYGLRERALLKLDTQSFWISQSGDPLLKRIIRQKVIWRCWTTYGIELFCLPLSFSIFSNCPNLGKKFCRQVNQNLPQACPG